MFHYFARGNPNISEAERQKQKKGREPDHADPELGFFSNYYGNAFKQKKTQENRHNTGAIAPPRKTNEIIYGQQMREPIRYVFPGSNCCDKKDLGAMMAEITAQNLGGTNLPMSVDQTGYLALRYDQN